MLVYRPQTGVRLLLRSYVNFPRLQVGERTDIDSYRLSL